MLYFFVLVENPIDFRPSVLIDDSLPIILHLRSQVKVLLEDCAHSTPI